MFQVSVGTLRHYEQAGLLSPEYVDPASGYRYYSVRQFEVLNTIRYFRVLDLSLLEIREFLENRDVDMMEEKLQKQKRLIQEKQRELARVARKIDRRLEEIQKETAVFLGKVGVGVSKESLEARRFSSYEMVFLILDPEDRYEGRIQNQQEELCAVIRFCGSHAEAPRYYERLLAYICEHHLHITGFSQEITLIDNGLTDDPTRFLTEIRVPVERA